ncbi:MAG: CRTAC1 family protein [Thermoplasmatota archaeon]
MADGLRSALGIAALLVLAALVAVDVAEARLPGLVANAPPRASKFSFVDATASAGLGAFRHTALYDASPAYVDVVGGGVAIGDYNGDGRDDIFVTDTPATDPHVPNGTPSTLFRANGDGTFTDVTRAAGLADLKGLPQGAVWFDYDNDGHEDLYVAAYGGGQLFHNNGDGTFTDVTKRAGLDLTGACGEIACFSTSVAAGDYDRDGLLDLAIANDVSWNISAPGARGSGNLWPGLFSSQDAFLFHNNGDGTFTDVTNASGATNDGGKGLGVVWTDVNGDGWPDLYFADDLTPNTLYLNQHNGTFREVAHDAGLDALKSDMGIAVGDYDNDGRLDIATTNIRGTKISLFHNEGNVNYTTMTNRAGLKDSGRSTGWGIEFADFDLDGWPDLAMAGGGVDDPTREDVVDLYFRDNHGTFVDATDAVQLPHDNSTTRGLALIDANNDGRPDFVAAGSEGGPLRLVEDAVPSGAATNHYLDLVLEGNCGPGTRSTASAPCSPRDAAGAFVQVLRADGLRMTQEVHRGESFESCATRTLFFGLADSPAVSLYVRWPDGREQTLTGLPFDARIGLVEGATSFVPLS